MAGLFRGKGKTVVITGGILNCRRRLGGDASEAMMAADMLTEPLRSLQKRQIGYPCLRQ